MNEETFINQAEMLQAINRSEVDIQVSTAKQYPRHLPEVLNRISTYATMDTETAEGCFYALRRKNPDGTLNLIEGISVRLAEIIAGAWGNLRVQARIIGNDGKTITSQGICHDLETNLAVSVEVKRRITDRNGRTYGEDMQVVTGNAASAIAFRNAVMKVVPKAVTKKVVEEIKQVAMGKAIDLETGRENAFANYAKAGVSEKIVLDYLGISNREEIDKERLFSLKAAWTAIKEGTTTVEDEFLKPAREREAAAKTVAEKKKDLKDKKKTSTDANKSETDANKPETTQPTEMP